MNVWFDYPLHTVDRDGELAEARPAGEIPPWEMGVRANADKTEKRKDERNQKLLEAYAKIYEKSGAVKVRDLVKELQMSVKSVHNYIDQSPFFDRDRDGFVWQTDGGDGFPEGV